MKKQLIISMIIMAGSMGAKAGMALSFADASADGNTSGKTDSLILNTGTLAVSGGSLTNATALSGTSTVNDEFTLAVNIGFAFDRTDFTWDTTDATTTTTSENNIKINNDGVGIAPDGDTGKFTAGEILFFTVSGLEEGNSLKLSGYTIIGSLGKYVDFFYEQSSGDIQRFNTTFANAPTAIDYTFSNGDKFGFAYYADNTDKKGNLGEITFDVIPEPATLGLVATAGIGVLFIRRRLMM